MGVVTLLVQPDEQIERVVAGSDKHDALMMLKKMTSGVSAETRQNGLARRRNYLAEEGINEIHPYAELAAQAAEAAAAQGKF
jgi:hypothetical protein